ncbi:MFS transporter [Telmatobacter bradus]|uniref:MFS transporter n=1 Tax=Telmatobacter bradus TaxID=474953 RepID=UPI003B431C3F
MYNTAQQEHTLPRSLIFLMASGTGFAVASLYYAQPILSLLAADLRASDRAVGMIPTLTQLGYALGILLLSPLGDRHDRRQIILMKTVILAISLVVCGMACGIGFMMGASLLMGISATLAQDVVPAAAHLAPQQSRGKVVGTVMTGLLLGILLSRVVSGVVAEQYGWRVVYDAAALSIALFGVLAWKYLPHFSVSTQLSYASLLASMKNLWREHSALRQASYAQGLLSMGFSAFWTTLALMLHHTFHLESSVAGAFGLAGAAGAIAAPLAGRMADRRTPDLVARLGCAIAAVSFAATGFSVLLSLKARLVLLAMVAIGFDFGVQSSLVAHQTIVFGIAPKARSRANALLVTCMFLGMAAGSVLGSIVLARWGWSGVMAFATATSAGAFVVRLRKGHASSKQASIAIPLCSCSNVNGGIV